MDAPEIDIIQLDLTHWPSVVALGLILIVFVVLPAVIQFLLTRQTKKVEDVKARALQIQLDRIEEKVSALDGRLAFIESDGDTSVTRTE